MCARCGAAGERRQYCRDCGAETAFVAEGAAGTVYTWTTVQRGMPGVAVPYTLAYADFEDGLRLFARVNGSVAVGDSVTITTDGSPDVFRFVAAQGRVR